YRSPHSAQICAQIVTSWKPGVFDTRMAPEPRDLLWTSLLRRGRKDKLMGRLRQWAVFVAVWSLTVFWLFPISFILGLTSIESLSQHFAFLRYFLDSSLVVRSFIQNILPTLLVTLFMSLLPWILLEISKQQDFVSYSELEECVLGRYYHFAIFNVLIVFLLGTTFLSTMLDVLYEPARLTQLLANSLPQGANFFLNYILFNACTHAMELIQLGSQLFGHFFLTLPWVAKTPRILRRLTSPWSFPFYYYYPNHILVFVITSTYSVIQPLILIFALFYYILALACFKHQFAYCYIRRYESNGARHFRRVARYTSDGLIIFQLTMVGLLYLKGVPAAATALLPLIVITLWAKWKLSRLFGRRSKHPYVGRFDGTKQAGSFGKPGPSGWWGWVDDIWKISYVKAWWANGRYATPQVDEERSTSTSTSTTTGTVTTVTETTITPKNVLTGTNPNTNVNTAGLVVNALGCMDSIKSRVTALRGQSEAARQRGDELEARQKQLTSDITAKEHELTSLQTRVKNLEKKLDDTESKLTETSSNYNKADLDAVNNEKKVAALEAELIEKEQKFEELTEKYKATKAELEEFARQFDDM
ncbi:hypothetical protein J3Q64DRAFT_1638529, partial [Phycomyces blakesleeanus]